jgi:hypothetical protein
MKRTKERAMALFSELRQEGTRSVATPAGKRENTDMGKGAGPGLQRRPMAWIDRFRTSPSATCVPSRKTPYQSITCMPKKPNRAHQHEETPWKPLNSSLHSDINPHQLMQVIDSKRFF